MTKISINLLPPEFTMEEVKRAKFIKVQTAGVAVILLMVFLSSLTVALRVLQSHNIQQVETKYSLAEQRVSGLKDVQASLILLKNRLTAINQHLGTSSKQASMYKLLDTIIPNSVTISSLVVDKSGNASVVGVAPDSEAVDSVISSLTDKELNENRIAEVSIDSMNRGRDGLYRISLKIKAN